jgi:hypothetical protein
MSASIARRVKLADLEDNMDLSRIAQPTAREYARVEKYKAAKVVNVLEEFDKKFECIRTRSHLTLSEFHWRSI